MAAERHPPQGSRHRTSITTSPIPGSPLCERNTLEKKEARPERAKWAGLDSNQRRFPQQFYRLPPLATRVPTQGVVEYQLSPAPQVRAAAETAKRRRAKRVARQERRPRAGYPGSQ